MQHTHARTLLPLLIALTCAIATTRPSSFPNLMLSRKAARPGTAASGRKGGGGPPGGGTTAAEVSVRARAGRGADADADDTHRLGGRRQRRVVERAAPAGGRVAAGRLLVVGRARGMAVCCVVCVCAEKPQETDEREMRGPSTLASLPRTHSPADARSHRFFTPKASALYLWIDLGEVWGALTPNSTRNWVALPNPYPLFRPMPFPCLIK
jgi:hypothetical protein